MKPQADQSFLSELTFEPLSKDNWEKFEELFGQKGACGNCWCMSYRLGKKDFENGKTDQGNKLAMKALVWSNQPTGILAIHQNKAIGWCAFSPRECFVKLERSRVHKRIDEEPVWSIPCTFIAKAYRRKGLSVELLKGVIEYARANNIATLEAYPTIPTQEKLPDAFAWIGLYKSFARAGFTIVDQTSINRPMVRYSTKE